MRDSEDRIEKHLTEKEASEQRVRFNILSVQADAEAVFNAQAGAIRNTPPASPASPKANLSESASLQQPASDDIDEAEKKLKELAKVTRRVSRC